MNFNNPKERGKVEKAIKDLIKKGAVKPCKACEGQFLSRYFLRPKSDGTDRFILNLEKLNEFIDTDHFKIENMKDVEKLLMPDSFMGKIDLKDTYFLINVHEDMYIN